MQIAINRMMTPKSIAPARPRCAALPTPPQVRHRGSAGYVRCTHLQVQPPLAEHEVAGAAQASRVFRILPKDICSLDEQHFPLFFLAGPLSGGEDWQSRMCEALLQFIPKGFTVAIPYGLDDRPPSLQPPFSPFTVLPPATRTERQLAWERHYLDVAAGASHAQCSASAPQPGCIVFWLPVESALFPKPASHGPYAQDTRGELGEWRGRLMHDRRLRVVVGGDERFPGFDTMERNFTHAVGGDFKVYRTIQETAAAAAAILQ